MYIIDAVIILLPIYSVFAAWIGAQILVKSGESERFWFFIILLFNFWALVIILVRPSFRKGLGRQDNVKLVLLAIGYWVVFLSILATLGVFSESGI